MNADELDRLVKVVLPRITVGDGLCVHEILDDAAVPPPDLAAKVVALREIVRCGGRPDALSGPLLTSRDVATYFGYRLGPEVVESMWVVGLDSKNRARVVAMVAKGGVSSCAVVPRDIFRPVVISASCSVILVHNHPSGDPRPSAEDIAITTRVVNAGELLGITVLDHVVVGADGYFSFADAGLLKR